MASLRCLRAARVFPGLREALARASHPAFRVAHFSVQQDHIHLLVEADNHVAFSRGMRGLATRLALATNRALRRSGRVWEDRFHARLLPTPKAVRAALVYVLANARKHLGAAAPRVDPCSSAPWFEGFREPDAHCSERPEVGRQPPPVMMPRTWLLRLGWRRGGRVSIREGPRAKPPAR